MLARLSSMFAANEQEAHGPGGPDTSPSHNKPHTSSQGSTGSPWHSTHARQCQIDNSESVLEKIAGLYAERLLSDIVLVVGRHEFPAHRLILCASSDVFQVMLMNPNWSESREQRIVLQEASECVGVFELFLQYLYTGRINVSHTSVLPILALADKYNVKDLIETCCSYMRRHVVSASQQNQLMPWLQYTSACGHAQVARICMNHLLWNFEQVAASEDFASCDLDLLTTVLSQNDLVVHDEMTLYNYAVQWLQQQEERMACPSPATTPGELFHHHQPLPTQHFPPTSEPHTNHGTSPSDSFQHQHRHITSSPALTRATITTVSTTTTTISATTSTSTTTNIAIPSATTTTITPTASIPPPPPPLPPPPYHSTVGLTPSLSRASLRRESTSSLSNSSDRIEWLTYEVMKYVRFPMMTPRQLADLLLVPLTIRYKEFFVTRMAIGMSFHSGQWERVKEVLADPDGASCLLFTPRLYTAEQWSAGLSVDNLPALPPYHTRTLVFSTPASASELDCDSQLEWIVELYPKGVWFKKFCLIVWQGTVEVPESVLRTVRLSITAKDVEYARVRIAVLVYGVQDGIEHVISVVTTSYIFTADDNLLNLDDILPFDSLNDLQERLKYLLEPCDTLKVHIVISPLTDPKLNAVPSNR